MELVVVMAILGVLLLMAIPAYTGFRDKARNAFTVTELRDIEKLIYVYSVDNGGAYPATAKLSDIGKGGNDPWGNPYVYVNLVTNPGQARRDPNTNHPLNDDFDLYSTGVDGQTDTSNSLSEVCQDDLIRAGDGGFVGLASDLTQ